MKLTEKLKGRHGKKSMDSTESIKEIIGDGNKKNYVSY